MSDEKTGEKPGEPPNEKLGEEKNNEEPDIWNLDVERWKEVEDKYSPKLVPEDGDWIDTNGITSLDGGSFLESRRIFNKSKRHISSKLKIRSPLLIKTLQDAIAPCADEEYGALYSSSEVYIRSPYAMIFNNRRRLNDHLSVVEGKAEKHLRAFLNFLDQEHPVTCQVLDTIENGTVETISYDLCWLLYPPETVVYSQDDEEEWRAYKVDHLKFADLDWSGTLGLITAVCEYQCFDIAGLDLASRKVEIPILPFQGKRPIRSIGLVPGNHLPELRETQQSLLERGRKYFGYRGKAHFQEYVGGAWPTTASQNGVRVMIDYFSSSRKKAVAVHSFEGCRCSICKPSEDSSANQRHFSVFTEEEKFICCPSKIDAYSLLDKEWRTVNVSELRAVEFREDAFKRLVLNADHKTIVKSMVRSYLSKMTNFRDIVKGKGLGLVLLLHGSPGTGKTLTAECVAEKEQRPIYMVTCGNLGTEPDQLERKIKEVFSIAVDWNAVLLLDEADVFLQERDIHDLKRNALVSVFLRELEYFNGIMFLTTNRPGFLDEAFQSRIHVTLGLPDLDKESRLKVWGIFLKDLEIAPQEMKFISKFLKEKADEYGYLNGRQIRNAVRTALAIAEEEKNSQGKKGAEPEKDKEEKKGAGQENGVNVTAGHIKRVLGLGRDFNEYLKQVNRASREQRASALGYRVPVADQHQAS